MWDADFELGTTGPDLPETEVLPAPKLLSPKSRLEAIASILALAVLRRRVRTVASPADRGSVEKFRERSEKDLISVANRAFMRDKRVQGARGSGS